MVTVFTLDSMASGGLEKLNSMENNRLNLDELNRYSLLYLIGEPLSPPKVMIYVFMRSLNQLNNMENFDLELCNRLNCIVNRMIKQGDMSFDDIQKIVSYTDLHVWKGVAEYFYRFVDLIRRAGDLAVMSTDMLLVHQQRPNDPLVPGMWSAISPIGIWLKKLSVEWDRCSTQRRFNLIQKIRKYMALRVEDRIAPSNDTESYGCARNWIMKQIHLIQVCPSSAMYYEIILRRCEAYRRLFPEMHEASLLDALNYYRCKKMDKAIYSILQFFDSSVFRPNVSDGLPTLKNRMGTLDNRSLRYGTLLHARIYRLFGYREKASNLIFECVHQGQQFADNTCLRLAVVELAACEALTVSKDSWLQKGRVVTAQNNEHYITLSSLMEIVQNLELHQKNDDVIRSGSTCVDPSGPDVPVLNKQLMDAVQLVSSVSSAIDGVFGVKNGIGLEGVMQSIRCGSGEDVGAQSRMIREASIATVTSFRIQKGLWKSARSLASSLLRSNYSDGIAPHHELEAQAVASVNMIYSYAAEGNWDQIPPMLDQMVLTFPLETNWKCAEHVLICKNIVSFDDSFRFIKYTNCEQYIEDLEELSPGEALLRKSLLLSHQGQLFGAFSLLEKSYVYYSEEESVPFILKQRFSMQMAVVLAAMGEYDRAHSVLNEIQENSREKSLGLDLISAMAARRDAVILVRKGHFGEALAIYEKIKYPISTLGTSLEKCLYHFGYASAIMEPTQERLINLGLARQYSQQAGFPYLEKTVLRQCMKFYIELNDDSKKTVADSILDQWASLDEKYPGTQDWFLF